MKPVDMMHPTGESEHGDCLMACVASILEVSLETLPVLPPSDENWFDTVAWVAQHAGFAILPLESQKRWHQSDDVVKVDPHLIAPTGYAIAIGPPTGRNERGYHAVVALDGHVVHDPHPTRTGITGIEYWIVFVPLMRERRRLAQQLDSSDIGAVL